MTTYLETGIFYNMHLNPPKRIRLDSKNILSNLDIDISLDTLSNLDQDMSLLNKFFYNHCCSQFEKINRNVLSPGNEYYRRGCLIAIDNKVIGHVKFKGEKTFLAWRTIKNKEKYDLLFGGIYTISRELLYDNLEKNFVKKDNEWGYIAHLKSLELEPLRFSKYFISDRLLFKKPLSNLIIEERERLNLI